MRLNYITTQDSEQVSGGWSGLSHNLYVHLAGQSGVKLRYVGPINPAISKRRKLVSKAQRILGGRSAFYPFSEHRLQAHCEHVQQKLGDADYNFFLGVTPWIRCRFDQPYAAYLDACFRTYFDNNLQTDEFCPEDIARIALAEKEWLEGADHVFWASTWSRDEAVRHYGLSTHNHHVVGIGGNLETPASDSWDGQFNFLFIAQKFTLKGGPIACQAFRAVHQRHPDTRLIILGQKPPNEFLRQSGVEYGGYLQKSVPDELAKFRAVLASSFCLVYPTTSDTIGQVIIECGYFGCPAIAPRRFAIPELVLPEKTGILLDAPFTPGDLENAMFWMLGNRSAYNQMRLATRQHCTTYFTFKSVADRITQAILAHAHRPRPSDGRGIEGEGSRVSEFL